MAHFGPLEGKLVALIGGGGFLGSHVVQDLLKAGARVRIAERNPESAAKLKPLANLGQLQFCRCDVKRKGDIAAAVRGADAVVYLVGTFGRDAQALQADGARMAAQLAAEQGVRSFVFVSAIGADAASDIEYARTKGQGEDNVFVAFPQATIVRPSVVFGEEDAFLTMFANAIATLPVLPVFGENARLQPVWVDDAAAAIVTALADPEQHGGKTYELAGPQVITMGQLNSRIASAQGRDRHFIALPDGLSALIAALPCSPISSDQWKLLQQGNVASGTLPGIEQLGVQPKPLDLFLDRWMMRYRKYGRFSTKGELA